MWIPLIREVTPASKLKHFKAAEETVCDCQRGGTQLGQVLVTDNKFRKPLVLMTTWERGLSKMGRDPGFEIYRYGRQIACFRWIIDILVDFLHIYTDHVWITMVGRIMSARWQSLFC